MLAVVACALTIASPKRLPSLPDGPTFAEAGLVQVNNVVWHGLVAPAGTSLEVAKRVHAAAVRTLQDPAINTRLLETGSLIDGNTPEQYAAQIKRELDLCKKIAKDQNIRLTELGL